MVPLLTAVRLGLAAPLAVAFVRDRLAGGAGAPGLGLVNGNPVIGPWAAAAAAVGRPPSARTSGRWSSQAW